MEGEGEETAPEQAEIKSIPGEAKKVKGEDVEKLQLGFEIKDKKLTFEEASRCLNTLGKDESGIRYAYLMMSATDRKLTDINIIINFKHVLFVDVTGNYLKLDALQVLAEMPFLVLIKAERNILESAALKPMPFLQALNLNRNKISETADIDQPMLECLELNYNEIYTSQFDVARLGELKQLELRGNHLFDISGIYPPSIENLYLAENKITRIVSEDLSKLANLKILHLRDNNLRKLNGFTEHLENLTYLNLRRNKINKLCQLRKLACLSRLETLIVSENPVAGSAEQGVTAEEVQGEADEEEFGEGGPPMDPLRIGILVLLPNLKRINKVPVTSDERNAAANVYDAKLEQIMQEESSDEEMEYPATEFTTDYSTEAEMEGETETEMETETEAEMEGENYTEREGGDVMKADNEQGG